MKSGSSRTMLTFVVAATSMLLLSACGDDNNSDEALGNIICADGSRVVGANCNGTNDCTDGSDEVDCELDCVASLPESSLCDGTEDCEDGGDELNCEIDEVCDYDDSQICDGNNDCFDGSDELGCDSALSASIFKDRTVFADAPVTLRVEGVDDLEDVYVSYANLNLDTVIRDGFVTFRMPISASGSTAILVGAEEVGRVRLQLDVQPLPELVDASETITKFKSDLDLMLPATEDTSTSARNFTLPTELLDANESVKTTVNDELPLLSAAEVEAVAQQVNVTNLLMGAEAPVPPAQSLRKERDSEECTAVRAELIDYTERVRSGVNLIASNLRANASNGDLSDEAKRVAESMAYAYWTYLLRGALVAYDEYVDDCSTVGWQFMDPELNEPIDVFTAGVIYYPNIMRMLTLENPAVIEAMNGCELALDDVVNELADVLGIDTEIDFSAISQTEWRTPVAPEDVTISLVGDAIEAASVSYNIGLEEIDGDLLFEWSELVGQQTTFPVDIVVSDPTVTGDTVVPVSIDVPPSTLFCNAPDTGFPEDGKYLVSISSPDLGSQLLFELLAFPGEGPDDVLLDLYPLVRDACAVGTDPGCSVNSTPRTPTGEPGFTDYLLSEATEPLVIDFSGIFIDQEAYLPAGVEGGQYDLRLEFKPCQSGSFCGSGTFSLAQGGLPVEIEFAAEATNDVATIVTPASTCSEL